MPSPPAGLFAVSIIVAATGLALPFTPEKAVGLDTISASLLLSVLWLAVFLFAVAIYRTRALWLLLGMPIAAAMPIILIIWHHLPCPPKGCI
jgi:hypothetical protein